VANALPAVKDHAAFVTQSEAGAGVQELVDLMLADRSIGVSRRADLQS